MAGGGYGGQLVALNMPTNSETQLAHAQAKSASTIADIQQQTAPAQIAIKKSEARQQEAKTTTDEITARNEVLYETAKTHAMEGALAADSELAAPQASGQQPSITPPATKPLFAPEVEAAIKAVNPKDPLARGNWDQQMAVLSKTVPQAKQFIGQFDNIAKYQEYAATHQVSQVPKAVQSQLETSTAAANAPAGASPLATKTASGQIISPITGKADRDLTIMAYTKPEAAEKLVKMQAMGQYQKTGDDRFLQRWAPDVYKEIVYATTQMGEEKRKQYEFAQKTIGSLAYGVIELGRTAGPDAPQTRAAYDRSLDEMVNLKMMTPQAAADAKSKAIDWGKLSEGVSHAQTVVEALNRKAQQQTAESGRYSVAGYTPEGNPVLLNAKTGETTLSDVQFSKPTGSGANTFETKRLAWLAQNPNDEQGALQFANGVKVMLPQQAAKVGMDQAIRLAAADAMAGSPWSQDKVNAKAAEIAAGYTQLAPQNNQPGTTAGGTTNHPVGIHPFLKSYSPAALTKMTGAGVTNAQAILAGEYQRQYGAPTAQNIGDSHHPYYPRNEADFKAIPVPNHPDPVTNPFKWYIAPDGVPAQKTR